MNIEEEVVSTILTASHSLYYFTNSFTIVIHYVFINCSVLAKVFGCLMERWIHQFRWYTESTKHLLLRFHDNQRFRNNSCT